MDQGNVSLQRDREEFDVNPFTAQVLMRAYGLIRPLAIAGKPNAVCRRFIRYGTYCQHLCLWQG